MKFLIACLILILCNISFAQTISPDLGQCELSKKQGLQKLYKCHFEGSAKELLVLDLYGTVPETAYYHGYFLRREIEDGLLLGVKTQMQRAMAELDASEKKQFDMLSQCVISNYKGSVSNDFLEMVYQQHRGMKAAGSSVSKKELMEAHLMVEVSIYFESILRRLETEPKEAKREIINNCGGLIVVQKIGGVLGKIGSSLKRLKMGCTGISASASVTQDQALVLGRNFDTGLIGYFERHPMVLIQNNPNGIRSVGAAAAGMHYAGGISGFNNFGLVASLHQLGSEDATPRQSAYSSDTTPYLLHRVLNETTTLDQAVDFIKNKKGFGAWTIFLGDSKTDELASIEIAGSKVALARKVQHGYLGQSNHFLAPLTQQGGYEYSLNKTLESRARLSWVTESLQKSQGAVDAQWVIDHLSGHTDALVGQRAFGRTTTKIYTAATHVMVPARQEVWMTLGETYPTNQGSFVGIKLDAFSGGSFSVVGRTWAKKEYAQENWYLSQGDYVRAYLAQVDNFHNVEQTDKVIAHLSEAIRKSQLDGVTEFPYHYLRARLYFLRAALEHKTKKNSAQSLQFALSDLEELSRGVAEDSIRTHAYERGLVALWMSRVAALSEQKDLQIKSAGFRQQALGFLEPLGVQYPKHHDFQKLLKNARKNFTWNAVLEDKIEMPTVE